MLLRWKLLLIIAVAVFLFGSGFYLGWHLHNERVQQKALDTIEEVRKEETNAVKSSVKQSEQTYKKLQNEVKRADKIIEAHKQIKETDTSGVLDLPLPDATVRLLNAASGGEAVSDTSIRSDDKDGTH